MHRDDDRSDLVYDTCDRCGYEGEMRLEGDDHDDNAFDHAQCPSCRQRIGPYFERRRREGPTLVNDDRGLNLGFKNLGGIHRVH